MQKISVEIVPRSVCQVEEECLAIKTHFPQIGTTNIPDVLRLPMRSWEACRVSRTHFSRSIPHIRAQDFDLGNPEFLERILEEFPEILVVSGDSPRDFAHTVHGTRSITLISFIKKRFPHIRIYAALDPYRNGPSAELEYARQKLDAGAVGFFTQPFFNLKLLDVFLEQLAGFEVYWGISPVLSLKSRAYWEVTNRAIFSPGYELSLEYNTRFAKESLARIADNGGAVYFMPIKTDVIAYLSGVIK